MDSPIWHEIGRDIEFSTSADRPIYLQLADQLIAQIRTGKLRFGQKLPSTRNMAALLHLNRITISKAYEELQMQGWLHSMVGRGTFVSGNLVDHQPKAIGSSLAPDARREAGFKVPPKNYLDMVSDRVLPDLHLDDGFPDPRLSPLKELYQAYRGQLIRSNLYHRFGSYSHPAGPLFYREALSTYLNNTRSLKTTAHNIMSVRGTLMGINLVCNALIEPGDVIVSGVPGWKRAEHNFFQVRAKHIGIPVDEHGLVVEQLQAVCKRHTVRMVYVTPHHHYPTTVPLRIDRRLELLRLAHEYGFIIFEDDYDFDFHYRRRPLLPLASADENGMVIYCGSFSKSFSPAFRMGYLVAAENVIEHLAKVRILLDRQGDHMLDHAMAELLNDGTIQRYLRKALTIYEERRNFFCDLLRNEMGSKLNFIVPEGGMSVWTMFDQSISLEDLARKAYLEGLLISDGKAHLYSDYDANAMRLGFASTSIEDLSKSVEILRKVIG